MIECRSKGMNLMNCEIVALNPPLNHERKNYCATHATQNAPDEGCMFDSSTMKLISGLG